MERPEIAGDPRFFARSGPHTLEAVVAASGGQAPAAGVMLTGVAPLQTAARDQISFLDNPKYVAALAKTQAGAVLIHPDMAARVPAGSVPILCAEPQAAWARVAALFHPLPPARPGVHPTAVVDPTAIIHASSEIGPLVVVGARAEIGPRCRIGAAALIGDGVQLGSDCRIGPHVSLTYALLGERVTVHPGARVGQEGFGFAVTADGFLSMPQLGRVVLENDVEIGANTTIDRGALQDTVIGAGSRLDNLVQIGHNVRIGRHCVLVAQVGVSGSTIVDDHVMMGGQAGLTGHLRIGKRARIGAQAGIMSDVPENAEVVGSPAMPLREFFRQVALLRRMARRATTGTKENTG